MRAFTDLSALPGHTVVIDGEAYTCPDVDVRDMQGSVRVVPADRILAVQWHGNHGHGSIEGFGAMEGFTDRAQLAPFVSAWLRARARAKADEVDRLTRRQAQVDEVLASNAAAIDGLKLDIASETSADRIDLNRSHIARIESEVAKMKDGRPTDAQVAAARAELTNAELEVDADAA